MDARIKKILLRTMLVALVAFGLGVATFVLGSCASVKDCLRNPNPSTPCLIAQKTISCMEYSTLPTTIGYAVDDIQHGANEAGILAQLEGVATNIGGCVAASIDAVEQTSPASSPTSNLATNARPSYLHDYLAKNKLIDKDGNALVAFKVGTFRIKTSLGMVEVRQ